MSTRSAPAATTYAPRAMVSTVDQLATEAGVSALRQGGTAVDAAIAANAVLSVTLPNQCGVGGDLFAIVKRPGEAPVVLAAVGRAGTGADAAALRAEGHAIMPAEDDMRSVTIPGCVDGWVALSRRFGRLSLAELLEPAVQYAERGFTASAFVADAITRRAARSAAARALTVDGVLSPGDIVRRPGSARILRAIAASGRDGFFRGEFGAALIEQGGGLFTEADLAVDQAEWAEPLSVPVWNHRLWAPPPPSQGYVLLGAAWLADQLGLPGDPDDALWAHTLIESTRQAAYDRPAVLFDGADGAALIHPDRLAERIDGVSPDRVADLTDSYRPGGTTYLCAIDEEGTAVSLIQSNCMSFGSGMVAGDTGIWLHNRGIGFTLAEGHPNELRANRRPAHTLTPAMITDSAGDVVAVLGTRGGDSQPQVVLQLVARLLAANEDPASAVAAGRWVLRGEGDETSFRTWEAQGRVRVLLEGQSSSAWGAGLSDRGHAIQHDEPFAPQYGHAQVIVTDGTRLAGAADPRSDSAAVGGY
jgi:gamma-glutamyltranspeptidase/glutathione hydrolase